MCVCFGGRTAATCISNPTLLDVTGIITDGSGASAYVNGINCQVKITPTPAANYVALHWGFAQLGSGDQVLWIARTTGRGWPVSSATLTADGGRLR